MSVRYRYGTVSVLYRILRVGIGITPIPYHTDTENAKKWIPIGIGIGTGSVWDRYGIGMGSVFGVICSSLVVSERVENGIL
ncbi:hypothetical protein Hanom_Chr15g01379841 [Helianthus anomalus]